MALMMTDIREAVDGKFLVTRTISNQAEAGTIVHVMNATTVPSGGVSINYRITSTGQNYNIDFKSIKDFYKWCRPDTFIARNYDSFTKDEIKHYIKVNNRTFVSFCLPIILVLLIIIWVLVLAVLTTFNPRFIVGAIVSVVGALAVIIIYKKQKSDVKMKMYYKLSDKWGVKFK